MSFWRKAKRLFSTDVHAIVGKQRVFGTDAGCLDDGPSDVLELLVSIGRIVEEHLRIVCPEANGSDDEWTVAFFTSTASRPWKASFAPRDHGPVLALVNRALADANAPRRLYEVSKREGGTDFYIACATAEDVTDLRAAGWIVT